MRLRAVIFDCWDTLFFNKSGYLRAMAETLGVAFDGRFIRVIEEAIMLSPLEESDEPFAQLIAGVGGKKDPALAAQLRRTMLAARETQAIFPETVPVLEELGEQYRLGMLTNTSSLTLHALREGFPLDQWFDAVAASCETGLMKPEPRAYAQILARIGVSAKESLMVGDSYTADYQGALSAGLQAVLLDRHSRYGNVEERVRGLAALPGYIRERFA